VAVGLGWLAGEAFGKGAETQEGGVAEGYTQKTLNGGFRQL